MSKFQQESRYRMVVSKDRFESFRTFGELALLSGVAKICETGQVAAFLFNGIRSVLCNTINVLPKTLTTWFS